MSAPVRRPPSIEYTYTSPPFDHPKKRYLAPYGLLCLPMASYAFPWLPMGKNSIVVIDRAIPWRRVLLSRPRLVDPLIGPGAAWKGPKRSCSQMVSTWVCSSSQEPGSPHFWEKGSNSSYAGGLRVSFLKYIEGMFMTSGSLFMGKWSSGFWWVFLMFPDERLAAKHSLCQRTAAKHFSKNCCKAFFLQSTAAKHVFLKELLQRMFSSKHCCKACFLERAAAKHVFLKELLQSILSSKHCCKACFLERAAAKHVFLKELLQSMLSSKHCCKARFLERAAAKHAFFKALLQSMCS